MAKKKNEPEVLTLSRNEILLIDEAISFYDCLETGLPFADIDQDRRARAMRLMDKLKDFPYICTFLYVMSRNGVMEANGEGN